MPRTPNTHHLPPPAPKYPAFFPFPFHPAKKLLAFPENDPSKNSADPGTKFASCANRKAVEGSLPTKRNSPPAETHPPTTTSLNQEANKTPTHYHERLFVPEFAQFLNRSKFNRNRSSNRQPAKSPKPSRQAHIPTKTRTLPPQFGYTSTIWRNAPEPQRQCDFTAFEAHQRN